MLCAICSKNEATIHIQEISGGNKKILHICSECAARKTADGPAVEIGGFKLAEMLYNLTEKMKLPGIQATTQKADSSSESKPLTCPGCGWDTQGLRNTGRLGCDQCYETFRDIIDGAIGNMHHGRVHVGKKPGDDVNSASSQLMLKIMSLQKDLEDFILREEYEKAATVRDEIAKLKRKMKKNSSKSANA